MFITSWLGEVRLWKMAGSITPTAREKFRKKTVIPKDPVETVGINKTSLPSPGSNCCFEENPHLKTRIRKPFWFRCILCPQCKRRLGGVLSTEGGDRCPQAWAFFRSWLLPGGPGHHLADSWRKSFLESLVHDSGKTSGNNGTVPCGTYKAKLTCGERGMARQDLAPLPTLLFSEAGGQRAPGY